jgi:uncharacterized protein YjgD (DUF1641 family)
MAEKDLQKQINEINEKLDEILDCATQQRLRSAMLDDLLADLSIIGKDAFHSTVTELDRQGIELNVDDVKYLSFKIIKNLDKFTNTLSAFESVYDLLQDLSPVAREVIIDFIKKLHELEQKGYFSFFSDMLKLVDNVVITYQKMDHENIPEYSVWKVMKELRKPEMKKNIGFLMTFLKNLSTKNLATDKALSN